MIRRFLGLLLFIIISFTFCVLSSIAPKSTSKLEHGSFKGFNNVSKPILHGEENQGVGRVRYYMGSRVMKLESSEKTKGKGTGTGVYGGANVARRPRPLKNIANPLPPTTTPILILTMIMITLLQLV
ncbi:hypothetical protein L484_018079 [Morus notabilis]|uniref:Transmembrane protein n=1 Tax=Morus notabilis TaxID=981085 RepID=W9R390_9ROSA|nr:hypothetical protein L484_018079 [Morus notabilis]